MTPQQVAALALAALLVFWMVGAYNRLMALRNAIGAAWAQIDEALRHRGQAVPPLVQALREPLAAEQGALDTLLAVHGQAHSAAAALGARPLAMAAAAAWLAAETALASAASRVLALLEQHAELRADAAVSALAATWREGELRLGFARQLFDAAALAYNEALGQWPTRWLARLFGFSAAARIRSFLP